MTSTQFVDVPGGRIAYDVAGEGPLVVLCPGLADTRQSYRFLAPLLVEAGFRVASVDLRGHGESSTGWDSYTRADTAADLIAVIDALGEPAVLVGQSFSGGSATIAGATDPDKVAAVVEIGPFTRPPKFGLGAFLRNDHNYRTGALLLGRFALTGKVATWAKYLEVAYPSRKPADWEPWLASLLSNLQEPGRIEAARGMVRAQPTDAAASLATLRRPTLVVMGSADSDFADPKAEAEGIVAALPAGQAHLVMIDGAGHYPHAERPDEVATAVVKFLRENAGA